MNGFGHEVEAARPGLKGFVAVLVVGGGSDEIGQSPPHQLPLNSSNPHQRVLHHRYSKVQLVTPQQLR